MTVLFVRPRFSLTSRSATTERIIAEVRVSSGDVDDLPIARESLPLKADWDGPGGMEVDRIHGLNVYMGLSAVARVAALTHLVSDGNVLPNGDSNAAVLEVAQRDELSGSQPDDHVIAAQPRPTVGGSTLLGQGVLDRGDASECFVIGFAVVEGHDHSASRSGERASEAWKPFGWFGTQDGRQRKPRAAATLVNRHEVDGVRGSEQACSVAGHSIGGAVLHQPSPSERERQVKVRDTKGSSRSLGIKPILPALSSR
jgi:hypothetical protein